MAIAHLCFFYFVAFAIFLPAIRTLLVFFILDVELSDNGLIIKFLHNALRGGSSSTVLLDPGCFVCRWVFSAMVAVF